MARKTINFGGQKYIVDQKNEETTIYLISEDGDGVSIVTDVDIINDIDLEISSQDQIIPPPETVVASDEDFSEDGLTVTGTGLVEFLSASYSAKDSDSFYVEISHFYHVDSDKDSFVGKLFLNINSTDNQTQPTPVSYTHLRAPRPY